MSPRMRKAVLWAPALVVGSTAIAFALLPDLLGRELGYRAGLMFYWIVWGALFPLFVLKPRGLALIFRWRWAEAPSLNLLLILPPLLPAAFILPQQLPHLTGGILAAAAVVAIANGTLEEVLWRGTYLAAFPGDTLLGIVYPAVGFAFAHLSPRLALPSAPPGGAFVFWLVSLFLGLVWGVVAWRSRSVLGAVASHVMTDLLGLGALIYLR